MKRRFAGMAFLMLVGLMVNGCSSIARGMTEALLTAPESTEDVRMCEVEGVSFDGIRQGMDQTQNAEPKVTKVMMVHGISSHLPGYSSRFQKKLFEELGLNVTDSQVKTIQLDSRDVTWKDKEPHTLGQLRITRHTDNKTQRELIFYELTWSAITDPEKQALVADSANYEGLKRASLNASLKSFMNTTVPDLLIYTGGGQEKITAAVTQSVCWMLANDWKGLPASGQHDCRQWKESSFAGLKNDEHFFVTHSLGSRITIDTIQKFSTDESSGLADEKTRNVGKIVRDKTFTVFMMANQLPLLQMGRALPEVSAEHDAYCSVDGKKAQERVMKRMNIIAFSDPNDILSYPVPFDFAKKSIDSRICPAVTNISLNIASEKNVFDAVSFANPLQAHSGYMEDDRVIDLIANGMHHENMTPLIKERCKWLEVTDSK